MVDYLIQASKNVRHINHGFPVLVDLMEDIIPKELDNVPVTSLAPSRITSKSGHPSGHARWKDGKENKVR